MEDGEGSVFVDGEDTGGEDNDTTSEESTENEDINNQSEEDSEAATEKASDKGDESSSEESDDKGKKTDVTEKGTKLDPDPLSQANQLRANAERRAREYEAFLNDPVKVKAYLEDLEKETGAGKKEDEKSSDDISKLDPKKLETVEDLQNFAEALKEATRKEIAAVKSQLTGFTSNQQQKETASRIQSEIAEVQTKYPQLRELNPDGSKNPDYDEELDKLVGETYNELDLDQRTGNYRGKVNILSIADRIMKAKTIGEGNGSRKAQTDVIDKRKGRVITSKTGGASQTVDDSKLSPAATIAERMKRAASRR